MKENIQSIGILGATGYIGMCLTMYILENNLVPVVYVFSRDKEKFSRMVAELKRKGIESDQVKLCSNDELYQVYVDVLVNCAGLGAPKDVALHGKKILQITEDMDNLMYSYVKIHPRTALINISSGSVYGHHLQNVDNTTQVGFTCNTTNEKELYRIAKFYSEVKHRTWTGLKIVDIRVFGFAGEYIRLDSGFFLADIITSLLKREILTVSSVNIVRDYTSAYDLFNLIQCIYMQSDVKGVFDIFSKDCIDKITLLEALHTKFGLLYQYSDVSAPSQSARDIYVPSWRKAENIGYEPKFTSLENILDIVGKAIQVNLE